MKNILFVFIGLLLFSCQEKNNTIGADEADLSLLKNDFNYQLVGDVTNKMKTVTRIKIYDKTNNTLLQELSDFEAIVQENEQVIIEDLNFDGYADIRLLQFLPEDANIPFFYWLYNPKTTQFERSTALEVVYSPIINETKQLILSQWAKGDSIQVTDYYQYKGNNLVIIKQEIQENVTNDSYVLTVKQPINDSLQIIKQETSKREHIIN